jgi:hypothetical protein
MCAGAVSLMLAINLCSELMCSQHQAAEIDDYYQIIQERMDPLSFCAIKDDLMIIRPMMQELPLLFARCRNYLIGFAISSFLVSIVSFLCGRSTMKLSSSLLALMLGLAVSGILFCGISGGAFKKLGHFRKTLDYSFRMVMGYAEKGSKGDIKRCQRPVEASFESGWQELGRCGNVFLAYSFPLVLLALLLHFHGMVRDARLRAPNGVPWKPSQRSSD